MKLIRRLLCLSFVIGGGLHPQSQNVAAGDNEGMELQLIYINISGAKEEVFLEEMRLAYEAGVRAISFDVPVPWARGEDPASYDEVDRRLSLVERAHADMRILPRIGLSAPNWWLDEHPDDRERFDDGSLGRESVASDTWLADAGEALRLFVRHVESRYGDTIFGYHPCCQHTAEWFYRRSWEGVLQGLEPVMESSFRKYCTRQGIAAPSAMPGPAERHGKSGSVFRDLPEDGMTVHFLRFQQEVMVDAIEHFARIIKEETAGRERPVFVFYGYTFEVSGVPGGTQTTGHLALGRLLECPDVDVLCSPVSYLERGNGGLGAFMGPVDSAALRKKTWLFEDDTRTHLSDPADPYGRVETLEQTRWVHRRNFANCLVRGAGIWWMDLYGHSWLQDPQIWRHIQELRSVSAKLKPQVGDYRPEIAVIVDEDSLLYLSYGNTLTRPLLSHFRREMLRIGAPVGAYLWSDFLAGSIPSARMYLFVNVFAAGSETARRVHELLRESGSTAVWFYAPGYVWEGTLNAKGMTDLSGMPIKPLESAQRCVVQSVSDSIPDPGGWDGVLNPSFTVEEGPEADILARYSGTSTPAIARADRGGWESVYVAVPYVSAEFLRYLAERAGVHVFSSMGDVVAASRGFLSVAAGEGGRRIIRLPGPSRVEELLSGGPAVFDATDSFEVEFRRGETRYWSFRPLERGQ